MSIKPERNVYWRELQTEVCKSKTEIRREDGTERKGKIDWTWLYRKRFSTHY